MKIEATSKGAPENESSNPGTGEGNGAHIRPELEWKEVQTGLHRGERYIRYVRPHARLFRRTGTGTLVATKEVLAPDGSVSRLWTGLKRVLIGPPLASAEEIHERLSKIKALAVFSSDALSSAAYATDEILFQLVAAGAVALVFSTPVALAIALLLAVVATSYRQTVRAYPDGGGAYIVAHDNLGTLPGLAAAAALLIDYVLTVAVSISAGVHAITSAFPNLRSLTVELCVAATLLMIVANLRGVRESGNIFAAPTYLFIFSFAGMIAFGLFKIFILHDPAATAQPREALHAFEPLSIVLLLRAFSSGAVALTGTEAIANGVPAFKPPESRNAATTLAWMATILGTFFLGLTVVAYHYGITPVEGGETVPSQVARTLFGTSAFYYLIQAATMLILILAANTAFQDFPRLSSILARDGFMPRQFAFRGERLAFSTGIAMLGLFAITLIVVFGGDTHNLIPLYSVGVFLSFTLSQTGMVRKWWHDRGAGWQRSMAINGFGAILTAVVLVVTGSLKFQYGAWMVIVLIPILMGLFLAVRTHYRRVAEALQADKHEVPLQPSKFQPVVIPVGGINKTTLRAVAYARSISANITAVHVTDNVEMGEQLRAEWQAKIRDIPLVIVESPYRSLTAPLLRYIDAIGQQDPQMPVTVLLTEVVPEHWWEHGLHTQNALRLKTALFRRPNTVVIDMPYHLEQTRAAAVSAPVQPVPTLEEGALGVVVIAVAVTAPTSVLGLLVGWYVGRWLGPLWLPGIPWGPTLIQIGLALVFAAGTWLWYVHRGKAWLLGER